MLILKHCNLAKIGSAERLEAVYEVRHNTAAYTTILEQDFHLSIDPLNGKVEGKLVLDNLQADSLPEALAKMATWCERMAAALRTPMKSVAAVPVFQKDGDAIRAAEAAAESSDKT